MHEWWDRAPEVKRQLKGTPPATRAALKKLQPFYGEPIENADWHPLFFLSELSNRDKHRRLNVLARRADWEFVDAEGKPIFDVSTVEGRVAESDKGGTYRVTLTVRPDHANVEMYLLSAYQISLDEPPQLIGDLVQTITRINQFVDNRVLPTVKSLL